MKVCTLALVGSLSLAAWAQAFVPWSNPSGIGTNFDYFGGGSDFGLFGSPILVGGDTFRFFPSFFRAQSSDGRTAQTHDRMTVELLAHTGERLEGISFVNPWTYNVVGEGSSITGIVEFFVTDLNNFRVLHYSYTLPPGLTGSGEILAGPTFNLPFDDPDWSHIQLVVRTDFIATSGPGGLASVGLNGFFSLQVPAPGSLALLGVTGLLAPRRRR